MDGKLHQEKYAVIRSLASARRARECDARGGPILQTRLKLYDFRDWSRNADSVKLTELDSGEVLFQKEFLRIEKGWNVIDVGARVGYYTIQAGLRVGSEGKVLAIEAHPRIYRVLKMNIRLYKLANVIPVCKAVGNETRMVRLFESYDSGGTSVIAPPSLYSLAKTCDWARVARWFKLAKKREFTSLIYGYLHNMVFPPTYVPIDTIDNIVKKKKIDKINLMKIDVQGSELDVLKGSHIILEEHIPTLLVEIHPELAPLKAWKAEDLYGLLRSYGYRLTIQRRLKNPMVVARAT